MKTGRKPLLTFAKATHSKSEYSPQRSSRRLCLLIRVHWCSLVVSDRIDTDWLLPAHKLRSGGHPACRRAVASSPAAMVWKNSELTTHCGGCPGGRMPALYGRQDAHRYWLSARLAVFSDWLSSKLARIWLIQPRHVIFISKAHRIS